MNNQQLNNLVIRYQADRTDETFAPLYEAISSNWRSLSTVAKSILSNEADVIAAYQDTLLTCLDIYDGRGDFINLLNRCIWRKRNDIYKVAKGRKKHEAVIAPIENEDGSEAATYELADDFNLEEYVISQVTAKKKADQQQLIDFLLSDADATTTAIVEAFLQQPASSATAIANGLGLHHSVVLRKIKRLGGKFDSRQYGFHRDYLVAL
jgi:hypothetical protein